MGNILSFRKTHTNIKEQLRDIENEIDAIEEHRMTIFVREKNYYALFVLILSLIYIFVSAYLYVTFDRTKILLTSLSLAFWVLFPFLAYYSLKLNGMYFKWKRESNNLEMMKLTKLKRKLISEVKETATFNEAKEILTKYDPSALRGFNSQGPTSPTAISSPAPRVPIMSPRRQSNLFNNSLNVSSSTTKGAASVPPSTPALMPPLGAFPGSVRLPQQAPRTVKPILSQHRSIVEKAVDYMFSDGPNNRYALICAQCCMHNGMALADEFEYISYVCAYCTAFNPARKTRPPPPITLAQQQQQQPGTQMLKAIEGPKVELPDDDEGVKITELTCDTSIIQAANTSAAEITSPSKDISFIDADNDDDENNKTVEIDTSPAGEAVDKDKDEDKEDKEDGGKEE